MAKTKRKKRTLSSFFYLLVFLTTFMASLLLSYVLVTANASSVGSFLQNITKSSPSSTLDPAQTSSASTPADSQTNIEESSSALSSAPSAPGAVGKFGTPLPQSSPAKTDFFKKTLFIGDRHAAGLARSETFPSAKVLADDLLTLSTAFSGTYFPTEQGKIALVDSFKFYNPEQIYLVFGTTDLEFVSTEVYLESYTALIEEVQAAFPGVPIVLQAVLPVSTAYEKNKTGENNAAIQIINSELQKLCAKYELYYVDIAPELLLNGALDPDRSTDGKSLNGLGFKAWMAYLSTHTLPA